MTKHINKQIILIYTIIFAIALIGFNIVNVNAQEIAIQDSSVLSRVFEVEINNNPNFEAIKTNVLEDDVKYLAHPDKLIQDVVLSEIVASDIDYSTYEVQQVNIEVERYADSNSDKAKIDSVSGVVNLKFIDTIAPAIELKKEALTITEGENVDVNDYLGSVTDNSFDEVTVDIEEELNTKEPGKYDVVYTATDSSGNKTSKTLIVNVKEKPKPKPKPIVVKAQAATSAPTHTTTTGAQFAAGRVTRYGYDCGGCNISNGYASTASGIKLGADSVRQSNGVWQQGYTYDGYHIVATSSSIPMFSIIKISNHPFSGGGIVAGQPFYAIVGDRGVAGNNIDLFVGTERNLNVISQYGNPGSSGTIIEVVRYGR